MEHPLMFDPDDPLLARVRGIALGLPGAAEKLSHGRVAFYTGKVFAYYSGSCKVDGTWVQHPRSVLVLADLDGQSVLRSLPGSYVPGYLGGYGWTGLDLDTATDWDEVSDFVRNSYLLTAPAALRRQAAGPNGR
jgi:hypothetical protein